MTIGDWIGRHSRDVPPALTRDVLALLGPDAERDASDTLSGCLAAAARGLGSLVAEEDFGRAGALRLLAVDALTTYAMEHAAEHATTVQQLRGMTDRAESELSAAAVDPS